MLENFLRRVHFLRKSTNQHGVHSPFVYSFLTKGIYDSKIYYKNYSKKHRLLQATSTYFHIQEIQGSPNYKIRLQQEYSYSLGKNRFKKLYYISDLSSYTPQQLEQLPSEINADTLIYIHMPNHTTKARENWLKIQSNPQFHVSIDFYIAGIVATRKEQKKEHFRLRV